MASTKSIPKEIRDEIVAQALQEIQFARTYKQGKVKNWQTNERLYYSRKVEQDTSRANVDLGQMSSFVHTLLAKIDDPLRFKYMKRKEAQRQRVLRLNAIRERDQQVDDWDIKDLAGKKQVTIYGRAIYSYFADSINGYCSHLDNVDVYNFLIDPAGGGLDIDKAMYLGRYGIIKTKDQLREGAKDGLYFKYETTNLVNGAGNAGEKTQERTNQQNRTYDTNVNTAEKEIQNTAKFVFWEWYTTFYNKKTGKSDRYYLLMQEASGSAIRIEKLSDIFPIDTIVGDACWPFWSYAAFIDMTEFWTPSFCDYVREIYMAEAVSINQMLDNSEQINKPQKVVNVGAIEDLAQLKYRRDGYIKVKAAFDVDKALQVIKVAPIDGPLEVFKILDAIAGKASGVDDAAKGVAPADGTLGVYEGNQANTSDRFGLLNKSYAFGYKRFAKLYEYGVKDHLTKKIAVEILGPDGVQIEMVSKRDIFRKDDIFGLIIESSNAEVALSQQKKNNKLQFINAQLALPNVIINPMKAVELGASISGFSDEETRQLLDTSEFGDSTIMSEADRDIERILDGEKIPVNQAANTAYKQRFVDYMRKNFESIKYEDFKALSDYILRLNASGIIIRNMVQDANAKLTKAKVDAALSGGAAPTTDVPPVDPMLGKGKAPIIPTKKTIPVVTGKKIPPTSIVPQPQAPGETPSIPSL